MGAGKDRIRNPDINKELRRRAKTPKILCFRLVTLKMVLNM